MLEVWSFFDSVVVEGGWGLDGVWSEEGVRSCVGYVL